MPIYQLGSKTYAGDGPDLQAALAIAYKSSQNPQCLCQDDGVEMYIAHINGHYFIKRMPNTGHNHNALCESYEPPLELSGLGEVLGKSITEEADGTTALKLAFSLSKSNGTRRPVEKADAGDSIKASGNKLTPRATLHYLLEQAGFNRWTPAMVGKRNWFVIRKYLQEAAANLECKGASLDSQMYIPENFNVADAPDIAQRRLAILNAMKSKSTGAARQLKIFVAEIKEITETRGKQRLVLKHLPETGQELFLDADVWKGLHKRFSNDIDTWKSLEGTHLMAVGTFSVTPNMLANVEEISLVVMNQEWIPFENFEEYLLLKRLVDEGRRFVKSLRYNMANSRPLATAVLTDTPQPTALFILRGADEDGSDQMSEVIAECEMPKWVWVLNQDHQLPLPEIA